jgi:preprotein translocase subunit SecA
VYSLRSFALEGGEELKAEAEKMIASGVEKRVENALAIFDTQEEWDFGIVRQDLLMHYMLSVPGFEDGELPTSLADAKQRAHEAGSKAFADKMASLGEYADQLLSLVMLHVLDEKWKDHLYDLDQLRNAIQYRSWGQKDPLIEYKHEAYTMFVDLMSDIHNTFTERFLRAQLSFNEPQQQMMRAEPQRATKRYNALGVLEDVVEENDGSGATLDVGPEEPPQTGAAVRPEPTVQIGGRTVRNVAPAAVVGGGVRSPEGKDWSNVGRNDPCPCGSGKKCKKCHGQAV